MMRRFTFIAATAVLCLPSLFGLSPATAFQDVSEAEVRNSKPGAILRVTALDGGAPQNAKAYRVLYRSTGLNGEPVAITGAIIFPENAAPQGGRHVVAWAHPTTGVADRCAPTELPDLSGTIPGLGEMLKRGYVVVATDYQGLGRPGMHPYLIGESEAHAVLDSVRAARSLSDTKALDGFVVWGHSQGGHAALFTGLMAASYAPELKLLGVAAAAPATYLAELFEADINTVSGRSLTAMTLLSWSKLFRLPLDKIVAAEAFASFEKLANDCIQSVSEFIKEDSDEKPLEHEFLRADPTKLEPWRAIMDRNTPGRMTPGTPVFLAQGTGDDVVRPAITRQFKNQLCGGGALVKFHVMDGVSHMYAGYDSAFAAVKWMSERFSGAAAPNDC